MIYAKYVLDESAMLEAWKWHWRSQGMRRWAMPAIGLFMLFSYGISWVLGIGTFDQVGLVFLGIALLFVPEFNKIQFRNLIRKMPMYQKEVLFALDQEKLKTEIGGNMSENKLSSYFLVRITSKGILVYTQKNIFSWIPRSGFASNEDFKQAVSIFKLNAKWKES